jgi:hypothetical protein
MAAEALQQLINKGSCANGSCSSASAGMIDSRDLPAFMAILLPAVAHKEAVELLSWLRLQFGQGQQQAVQLEQFEAAARELLSAREYKTLGWHLRTLCTCAVPHMMLLWWSCISMFHYQLGGGCWLHLVALHLGIMSEDCCDALLRLQEMLCARAVTWW